MALDFDSIIQDQTGQREWARKCKKLKNLLRKGTMAIEKSELTREEQYAEYQVLITKAQEI